jgi:hypothetical protein
VTKAEFLAEARRRGIPDERAERGWDEVERQELQMDDKGLLAVLDIYARLNRLP